MVAAVLGVLTGFGIPRVALAAEQSRVDGAAATLRSVWHAQRMHWIEEGRYAADFPELETLRLIEGGVDAASEPFTYSFTLGLDQSFTVQAVRQGSSVWSGTLTIDESGAIGGTISDGGSDVISPTVD